MNRSIKESRKHVFTLPLFKVPQISGLLVIEIQGVVQKGKWFAALLPAQGYNKRRVI